MIFLVISRIGGVLMLSVQCKSHIKCVAKKAGLASVIFLFVFAACARAHNITADLVFVFCLIYICV